MVDTDRSKAKDRSRSKAKAEFKLKDVNANRFNEETKYYLRVINTFLKVNKKKDSKQIFKEMDADKSGDVQSGEFVNYFMLIKKKNKESGYKESEIDRMITKQMLRNLFRDLDADGSKSLDLGEFCTYLVCAGKAEDRILENIDQDTQAKLDQ